MATNSSSASMVLPPSSDTRTPESVVSTPLNRAPSSCLMPLRRNCRSSSFDEDSSSSGTRCGSASTIVTWAPKEFHTEANSQPIAPAPSTTTDAGTRSRTSASSLVITRSWSMVKPGSDLASEPVASSTCRPSMRRSPTWTAVGPASRPSPLTTSILRLLTSPDRPL